jgi:cell division protein ZapA (FtsZ GTPase activity inhibitor)
MPKFDSPIGSKQFQGQPMREFSVPDDSGYEQPPQRPVRTPHEPLPAFDERSMREFQAQMQQPAPGGVREMTDIEKEIHAAKKAKREGKERLSDGARRRIEMLIGMTRLTREVDIGGQMYKLQTLTSQELRDAVVATAEFDGKVEFIFENRKQLLARAVIVVAGVPIDQFLNSNELDAKLEFIELIDHALLHRLYSEYVSLVQEAQNKYSPKTEEQAKEVVDDLKK